MRVVGLFDNLRKTIAVARGGEVDPNDLSPEQRALYEEQQARVAAAKADLTAARRTLQASIDRLHAITSQLQSSEELASAIVEGAADAIWTVSSVLSSSTWISILSFG